MPESRRLIVPEKFYTRSNIAHQNQGVTDGNITMLSNMSANLINGFSMIEVKQVIESIKGKDHDI